MVEWTKCKKLPITVSCIQLKDVTNEKMNELINEKIITTRGYDYTLNGDRRMCWEVKTLEGRMLGYENDYLIRGVNNEYYICEKSIFEKTYECFNGME